MTTATKLFHFFAGLYHLYFISYATIHEIAHPNYSSFAGRWKTLTFLSCMINCWYFLAVFCHDFVLSFVLPESINKKIKKVLDGLFDGVVCPAAILVVTAFWGLYYYNRAAIWPLKMDAIIPPLYNHMMHTLLAPIALIELALYRHHYLSLGGGLFLCTAYTGGYVAWLHVVRSIGGIWAYPIFYKLDFNGRCNFIGVIVAAMYVIFFAQHFLHQLVHGGEVEESSIKKQKQDGKVLKGKKGKSRKAD